MSEFQFNEIPSQIIELFNQESIDSGIVTLLQHILSAVREIAVVMRDGEFSHEMAGSTNSSGDHQLHIDLETDAAIFRHLRASGVVHVAASEENPVINLSILFFIILVYFDFSYIYNYS
jgi:fructose-1,6-bisphosphatase